MYSKDLVQLDSNLHYDKYNDNDVGISVKAEALEMYLLSGSLLTL